LLTNGTSCQVGSHWTSDVFHSMGVDPPAQIVRAERM
jgi:hypothetical protein